MQLISFDKYKSTHYKKKLNKKKVTVIVVILIIILIISILAGIKHLEMVWINTYLEKIYKKIMDL